MFAFTFVEAAFECGVNVSVFPSRLGGVLGLGLGG
jgi:hypothetical protein